MSYALVYDVPAAEEMYRQVKAAMGDEQPKGLVVHLVLQTDNGLRHIGVWDTEEDWQRFHDGRVEPAVHKVLAAAGVTEMPPEPPVQEFKLIDVQLGT
jgi:hypothetical protein